MKLIAVETHPIQYKAPLFRLLAKQPGIDLHVLYAMIPDQAQQGAGFGVDFEWDVPLLSGYTYSLLENVAKEPSVTRFGGCDTPSIYAQLKSMRPDTVLVNGWVVKSCLQALWACKRLNIPCWVRGEANLLRPRARWKHALHRLLLKQYAGYLAIGTANREFYRYHRCPDERIEWAPYSVENDRFTKAATERGGQKQTVRNSWAIPADKTVFLFSGKFIAKKRPLDVLHALALLPAEVRTQTQVLMVGDGPLRSDAERLAQECQLPVTFAGFVNQSRMPDAYAVADVLVLPSDAGETWGLVVNEAMASGRPAIVSDQVGCAVDLVQPGQTGEVYACGDHAALSSHLRSYVADPDKARQEGIAAQAKIRQYDIHSTAQGICTALLNSGRTS